MSKKKSKIRRPNGFFNSIKDKDLIKIVHDKYSGMSISEFEDLDPGVVQELRKRNLMDNLIKRKILVRKNVPKGFFKNMGDEGLIDYARANYFGQNLSNIEDNANHGSNFMETVRERGLLEELVKKKIISRKLRRKFFDKMSDDDFIRYMKDNHTGETLTQIQRTDVSGYKQIRKRDLESKLMGMEVIHRTRGEDYGIYCKMSDEELIDYIRENFTGKNPAYIAKTNLKLYGALRKRGIVNKLVNEGILIAKRKEDGYWKSWGNLENELRRISDEIGHFPTQNELKEMGRTSLTAALHKYHGGFYAVREKMGIVQLRNPPRYLQNWENVERELGKIIGQLGHFPTETELRGLGYSSIAVAMAKHGGINNFRRKMGYEITRQSVGYWNDFGNVERALIPIIEEMGHFPTQFELTKLRLTSLTNSITKYHGGMSEVRKKMGYDSTIKKPDGYWKSWENVERELNGLIERLGHFPTQKEFREKGFSSISYSITKYHGGMSEVRQKMGFGGLTIRTPEEFTKFLGENESVRNLALAAISLNGHGHDLEQVLYQVYSDRFRDQSQIHKFIKDHREDILRMAQAGITSLGPYLGQYSLEDRAIVPVLLGQALNSLPEEAINYNLEGKLANIMRNVYGPSFNENPETTLRGLEATMEKSSEKMRGIYKRIYDHYQEVLKLGKELSGGSK